MITRPPRCINPFVDLGFATSDTGCFGGLTVYVCALESEVSPVSSYCVVQIWILGAPSTTHYSLSLQGLGRVSVLITVLKVVSVASIFGS